MARTSVTTQPITRAGTDVALTAPVADGDVIDTGSVALIVDNAGVSAITVTVTSPVTVDGLTVGPLSVSIPAGARRYIGPLPVRTFGQPAGDENSGRAFVDYSSVTDVTRGVLSL